MNEYNLTALDTIYGWTIYKRKPKPKNKDGFCVGTSYIMEYKNFKSEKKAKDWISKMKEADSVYKIVLPVFPKKN